MMKIDKKESKRLTAIEEKEWKRKRRTGIETNKKAKGEDWIG